MMTRLVSSRIAGRRDRAFAHATSSRTGRLGLSGPCVLAKVVFLVLLAGPAVHILLGCCDSQAAGGLARIELASFYESEPIAVTPNALPCPLPVRLSEVPNASWVAERLRLDENDREALARNGFVVVPYGQEVDMTAPYTNLAQRGVPNFITSDSLLHLYHVQFDEILKSAEVREFLPGLKLMSRALQEHAERQRESLSGDLQEAARRNVAFFTVALKLLGEEVGVPDYVAEPVATELNQIASHAGFESSPIFIYREDYSQYIPRGHYTRSEELKQYFKAMMWYGRMAFLLKGSSSWGPAGEALVSVTDARIQTLQASLITLALDSLQANGRPIAEIWNRIYGVTAFFVGLADDLTPYEYKEAIQKVFGTPLDLAALADEGKLFELRKDLASLRNPQIFGGTGDAKVPPNATADDLNKVLDKTKGMRLMGQRFIPDSYLFQNLVVPVVRRYVGSGEPFTMELTPMGPARCFPRGLDVMAVLGSDAALRILDREGDTDYEDYDQTVNELIRLFGSFTERDWTRNLYWSWLYTLKPLLANCGGGYPAFMRSAAWLDKQLHTALGSWTELRHDTILYAKQSYTPGVTSAPPEPDRGYVEPVPEFYNRLLALTRMTQTGLTAMNVLDAAQANRLTLLEDILNRLTTISVTELEGRSPSEADYGFIERFGINLAPLGEGLSDAQAVQTALVADVHTDGNTGQVLEEGVGCVKLLVAAYPVPEGRIVLGAGPVFSYYEFKWPMSDRLTDEKWTNMLAAGSAPAEPSWVHSFTHPVTDPAETRPAPRLADLQPGSTGLRLQWNAEPAGRYRVCYSDDLKTWYLLKCPVIAEGAMAGLLDPEAATARYRFYQVRLVP